MPSTRMSIKRPLSSDSISTDWHHSAMVCRNGQQPPEDLPGQAAPHSIADRTSRGMLPPGIPDSRTFRQHSPQADSFRTGTTMESPATGFVNVFRPVTLLCCHTVARSHRIARTRNRDGFCRPARNLFRLPRPIPDAWCILRSGFRDMFPRVFRSAPLIPPPQ